MPKRNHDKISIAFADSEKITNALAQGVQEALIKHKQAGKPIVVWRNNRIVLVPAEKIVVKKK